MPPSKDEADVVALVRSHPRKGAPRGVRAHARRVHRHVSLIGPADKLYPWGTLYQCTSCGEPVIRDERAVRRFGPRRGGTRTAAAAAAAAAARRRRSR